MGQSGRMNARGVRLGGSMASAVGLFIIASAILADDAGFYAPRWIVAAAGGVFLLAGLMIFSQDKPVLSSLFRALLLTSFGAVFTWVSFGPGERQFSSTVSLPLFSFSNSSPGFLGRICFAPGAILLDVWALYSWFKLGQAWVFGDNQD